MCIITLNYDVEVLDVIFLFRTPFCQLFPAFLLFISHLVLKYLQMWNEVQCITSFSHIRRVYFQRNPTHPKRSPWKTAKISGKQIHLKSLRFHALSCCRSKICKIFTVLRNMYLLRKGQADSVWEIESWRSSGDSSLSFLLKCFEIMLHWCPSAQCLVDELLSFFQSSEFELQNVSGDADNTNNLVKVASIRSAGDVISAWF